jgi:V/A-type H+/Na+-transporting ATPase subunit I
MTIVALKKVSICGLIAEKEAVLDELQALGCLHLVSLREPLAEPEKAAPEYPEDAYKALKFLSACPNKRHQVSADKNFDSDFYIAAALHVQQRIREVTDRRDFLIDRIKSVTPWGDFQLPPLEDLGGYKLWFYIVPVGKQKALPKQDLSWQIVHKDNLFAYVVVIARNEPPTDAMPVERTLMGKLSLTELKNSLNKTMLELEDLYAERESLTRWIFLITKNLARTEDRTGLIHAGEHTLDNEDVFAVQGWIPEQDLDRLMAFSQQQRLAVLVENPVPDETPPTLMKNPDQLAAGESLVSFYQTPGYWDWDPSAPVFFSFAVFFAMILSDAGYALLFGAILFVYWHRLGRSETGIRMRTLLLTLISCSFIWGVMIGSYFGVTPPEISLLGKLKILEINDFDMMMRISVCVGVLHLTYANVHRAWRRRHENLTWLVPIGWILVMFGGILLWFDQSFVQPEDWYSVAGKWHLGLGLAAVFLFSSARAVKKPTDIILRLLSGLKGMTDITKIFGDILSYLRLFALGLAGASLSLTFNNLAMQAREIEGTGLLYSLLILLFGHTLNILLSLMSAVVHGLRLNVIEFFNWGLSDEGYPFKAYTKKEINE